MGLDDAFDLAGTRGAGLARSRVDAMRVLVVAVLGKSVAISPVGES